MIPLYLCFPWLPPELDAADQFIARFRAEGWRWWAGQALVLVPTPWGKVATVVPRWVFRHRAGRLQIVVLTKGRCS